MDQISYYFDNLQKTIQVHIYNMNSELISKDSSILEGNMLLELSDQTAKDIVDDIINLFKNLKPFFMSKESSFLTRHYGTIFTKIQLELQNFFIFLNNHFLEYLDIVAKTTNKENFGSRFFLALTSVCLYIESKGINQVVQAMNEFMNTAKQGMHSHNINDHGFSIITSDLGKRIKEAAQKILTVYTRMQSKTIEKMFRIGLDSTQNWLMLKEPRDVRQVNDLVLDELVKLSGEITKLLPATQALTTPNMQRVGGGGGHNRTQSGNNDAMRRNTSATNLPSATLFDKRMDVYSIVDFNANSILVGIIKIALKSYTECLRTKTFGTNGYHQIQVDLRFLRVYFTDMFGVQPTIDSLLQEADNTICDRCIDPIPLEESIIKKLSEDKFRSRKEEEKKA
ncbi:hypothetical protein SAMD00019534_065020, partial [Acytostelium subglobosum LB1]|uniref:hypothetical protein n=1 Tax=Acytostelium subglobosum LB1 TaxID=1410327 RepID=UPI0006450756